MYFLRIFFIFSMFVFSEERYMHGYSSDIPRAVPVCSHLMKAVHLADFFLIS